MEFLIGTEGGLFRVARDGRTDQLVPDHVRHVVAADEGAVALTSDGTLWSIDEDGATEFDELHLAGAPSTVLLDEDDVWLGTEGARLIVVRAGDVIPVEGFDAVTGRDSWYTPGAGPPSVVSLDIDDDGTLFAAVHVGGVMRSIDGGETWTQTFPDIEWDAHQVSTVPDYAKTAVAACGRGLAITIDSGDTWELDVEGLHSVYCRSVAVAGDHVVLSAAAGPDGGRCALYRRALDGAIFTRCRNGLPDWFDGLIDTHCISAWDELVVAGTSEGGVWLSEDAGENWRHLAAALPRITSVAIP